MIANNYDDLSEWSPVALLEEFDKISKTLWEEEARRGRGDRGNFDLINQLKEKKRKLRDEIMARLNRTIFEEKEGGEKEGSKNGDWLKNLVPQEIWVAAEETGRTGDSRPLEEELRKLRESVTAELIRT